MERQQASRRKGFTLIEVLAVIVIMAILAGGVFMMLGAGNDQANIAKTTAQIHAIASLLEDYRNCYGTYPRVTNADADGYAPLNFTFKIEDGGTCEECGNQRGKDGVAFGLCSHFIPRASKMYDKAADTNMAGHYEDCFSDPAGQDDNPTTLTISRKEPDDDGTRHTVLSIPLADYALLVKGHYNRQLSDQEYLDRQDEYNLTFFLDEDNNWASSSIIINSWRVVLSDVEL